MELQKRYETNLETAGAETIHGILDNKLVTTSPEGVADYITLGVDNLEDKTVRIDKAISDLKQMKLDIKSQVSVIKEQSASWLSSTGVDRLDGLIVSSITVSEPKPTLEVNITDDATILQSKYVKATIDKTAIKKALQDGVTVTGAELITTHNQPTLRINKRK